MWGEVSACIVDCAVSNLKHNKTTVIFKKNAQANHKKYNSVLFDLICLEKLIFYVYSLIWFLSLSNNKQKKKKTFYWLDETLLYHDLLP